MRRIFKKRFSMAETIGLLAFVVMGVTVYSYAVTTVPNTFTAGTTATASEVNANFSALATAIDTITSCVGTSASDIMVKVGPLCVDKYEASVWSVYDGTGTPYGVSAGQTAYPGSFPANGNWTTAVYAVSKAGVLPSTSVTWFQAQQACALSGKRLLTSAEWQMAAAGTPDSATCTTGSLANTGANTGCVSNWSVNDMVGNINEWVADWMEGGTIPWAPTHSGTTYATSATYGSDLMYGINPAVLQDGGQNFPAALFRGGSWNLDVGLNAGLGGVFALSAIAAPSYSDSLIGFRCAR